MAGTTDVLQPYVEARTLVEAEVVLDQLAATDQELPTPIGDLYDDLAEAAAEDGDYELAVRLERKAIEHECAYRDTAREMLGWYLLKAGARQEGEAVFAELRVERPHDVILLTTLAAARADSGDERAALVILDEAVALAVRHGTPGDADHARIERRGLREDLGLAPDTDDQLAPSPRPLFAQQVRWAVAWFPVDQRGPAAERWPDLSDDFSDPVAYNRRIEHELHTIDRETNEHPRISQIDVNELTSWAERNGCDPGTGAARSRFAAVRAIDGHALPWPPGRNEPCWCGSAQKYKRCCGSS